MVQASSEGGGTATTSSVQVAEHFRTYEVDALPAGLREYSRESRTMPGSIDSLLDPAEDSKTAESPPGKPLSVSTTVLFTAESATDITAPDGSENRPSLEMTFGSLPAGTTIDDQRTALSSPERLVALQESGYSREVIDVGPSPAELLTWGHEVTLRWWDEKGSVYLRSHHLEVADLLAFAESVK